jgi:hypothetical protein
MVHVIHSGQIAHCNINIHMLVQLFHSVLHVYYDIVVWHTLCRTLYFLQDVKYVVDYLNLTNKRNFSNFFISWIALSAKYFAAKWTVTFIS